MFIAEDLYAQILKSMPIPCVDLLIVDEKGRVLLLLRKNYPAADQWWFPGGRVLIGEKREDAVKRKLAEECGLLAKKIQEIGTYDLFFDPFIHSITSLFKVNVAESEDVQIDSQSYYAKWLNPSEWLDFKLHPFIFANLSIA